MKGARSQATSGLGVDEAAIRDALRTVPDPELGIDIVALGLIKQIEIDGGDVYVRLQPTSPSCPVGDLLRTQAHEAAAKVAGVQRVHVELDRGIAAAPAVSQSRLGVAILSGAAPPPAPEVGVAPRLPVLALGLIALGLGVWIGLGRLGGDWGLPDLGWLNQHGPLMVGGFLGTVIGLERAVGVGWRAAWAAPLLSALGAVALLVSPLSGLAAPLMTASSLALVGVYVVLLSRRPSGSSSVEAMGAVAWLVGNASWWAGSPMLALVPWWMAFLVLIIVGERIELSQHARQHGVMVQLLLPLGILLIYTGGLAGLLLPAAWPPIVGAGFATLAIWLWIADIARETVRRPGLPRFTAWALLMGYFWLTVAAIVMIVAGVPAAGLPYDAVLHMVFVGFVFAMIFGHAPIIFPAILRREIPFSRWFYVHLLLLQAGVLLRALGAIEAAPNLRAHGVHLNAVAVTLFLLVTVASVVRGQLARGQRAGASQSL